MNVTTVRKDKDPAQTAVDWAKRVEGTMVNATTLLATDYLNHFNEVLMLLQMVPDMPDMIEDCKQWRPKSYPQHFMDSGLTDGPLAAEAYAHSPPSFKLPFEAIIKQMDDLVFEATAILEEAISNGQSIEVIRDRTARPVGTLQTLNQLADSIIHGDTSTMNQAKIDQMLGG